MGCKKCEEIIVELITLCKRYRYSYITNAYKEVLECIEAGSIQPIRERDKEVIAGLRDTTEARAEMRNRKVQNARR